MMKYITGCLDTDIMMMNYLHDYELLPVLLINSTIANITEKPKFWRHRILFRLGVQSRINSNKSKVWRDHYQKQKRILVDKRGYRVNNGSPIDVLEYAISIDLRLSLSNLEDMLVDRRNYFYDLSGGAYRDKQCERGKKLFCLLPNIWYGKLKTRIICLNSRFDLIDELINIGNVEICQCLFDNLLYRRRSFYPVNSSCSYRQRPSFFKENLGLIQRLLLLNIHPSPDRVKFIFKGKYLSPTEIQWLSPLLSHLGRDMDKKNNFKLGSPFWN